jgi:integrase
MSILAQCPQCRRKQSNKNKKCACGLDLNKAKKNRRVKFWITYRLPRGQQRRESVAAFEDLDPFSIDDARDAMAKRKVQKRERKLFDMEPEADFTFSQLTEWYLPFEKDRITAGDISEMYYKVKETNLKNFNSVFGDMVVNQLLPADLNRYKAIRKQAKKSDSYIDQEVGAAKSMVICAFYNRKVGAETLRVFRSVKKLLRKGSNARKKVLSLSEYESLIGALPSHTVPIVATGYWTGMRLGEIVGLTWDKVDLNRRLICLEASDTKEGYAKKVPISKPLKAILSKLPLGIRNKSVFLYKSQPIHDIREGLINGCEKAGIAYGRFIKNGFIFHDLRHTAKTNMRKAGIDRNIRMFIFGHSNGNDMNFRYDTIDDQDLLTAVDQLEAFLQNVDQSVDHNEKKLSN